jgi:hypothetical protein
MTIDGLAERLIRMAERTPYHLERFEPESIDDGLNWMRDQYDERGVCFWLPPGDTKRRQIIKHWLWLRFAHDREIRARGLP